MHTERATTASILFKMINSQQRGKKFTRLVKLHGTRGWAGVAYTRGSLTRSLSHREQLPSFRRHQERRPTVTDGNVKMGV